MKVNNLEAAKAQLKQRNIHVEGLDEWEFKLPGEEKNYYVYVMIRTQQIVIDGMQDVVKHAKIKAFDAKNIANPVFKETLAGSILLHDPFKKVEAKPKRVTKKADV